MTQFKLVPVDPTESMTWAAVNAGGWSVEDLEKWQAMLAAAPSPWLPIETAPKDGTDVLVFNAKSGEQFVAYFHAGGYWAFSRAHIMDPKHVTHWIPLPPPPSKEQ